MEAASSDKGDISEKRLRVSSLISLAIQSDILMPPQILFCTTDFKLHFKLVNKMLFTFLFSTYPRTLSQHCYPGIVNGGQKSIQAKAMVVAQPEAAKKE